MYINTARAFFGAGEVYVNSSRTLFGGGEVFVNSARAFFGAGEISDKCIYKYFSGARKCISILLWSQRSFYKYFSGLSGAREFIYVHLSDTSLAPKKALAVFVYTCPECLAPERYLYTPAR